MSSLGTRLQSNTPVMPQALNATKHSIRLHSGRVNDIDSSSTTPSLLSQATTPRCQRRCRKPQLWRRSYQFIVDNLGRGWTALSDTDSTTRAASSASASDESFSPDQTRSAKDQKKRTITVKVVEYIERLEDEHRTLLATLGDTLLSASCSTAFGSMSCLTSRCYTNARYDG